MMRGFRIGRSRLAFRSRRLLLLARAAAAMFVVSTALSIACAASEKPRTQSLPGPAEAIQNGDPVTGKEGNAIVRVKTYDASGGAGLCGGTVVWRSATNNRLGPDYILSAYHCLGKLALDLDPGARKGSYMDTPILRPKTGH